MDQRFDYVIVGAGSAGATLASRLSESPASKVLLLEAGGPDTRAEISVPAYATKLFKTEVDWAYYTEPEPHLNNRRLYWPRGKVLGGCSSCNLMIYVRGNKGDFDYWEQIGNKGWAYQDVLPYFVKSENQTRIVSEYHGKNGPMNIDDLKYVNPLTHVFVKAGEEVGLKVISDLNGEEQEGVGIHQVNQLDGRRQNVVRAFLDPAQSRGNLVIQTFAMATQIILEKQRAVGVTYLVNGNLHRAFAEKEVILCGGSVNSPQLLMLSGIGPSEHLKEMGIPVVIDRPAVGKNLKDHLVTPITYHCKKPITYANMDSAENRDVYVTSHSGPLTSNRTEAQAFMRSDPSVRSPDFAVLFSPSYFMDYGFKIYDGHAYTFTVALRHAESTGQITLFSKDPLAAPRIQGNYLKEKRDRDLYLKAFERVRSIAMANAFSELRGGEIDPGPGVQTDEDILDYIKENVFTEWHPTGTCKMGSELDSVVDSRLRVHGVSGLRVVDASVMPTNLATALNATVIMIAEKAAVMIKEDNAT